jgi:uncharacterized protein
MKYLVLLLVVLAVVWFWRNGRAGVTRPGAKKAPPPLPQDMVQCPVCHVHLPRADALPGPDGQLYCCTEHRSRNE